MKALIYTAIFGLIVLIAVQIAMPIIDRAQAGYSAHERTKFCLLREQAGGLGE